VVMKVAHRSEGAKRTQKCGTLGELSAARTERSSATSNVKKIKKADKSYSGSVTLIKKWEVKMGGENCPRNN